MAGQLTGLRLAFADAGVLLVHASGNEHADAISSLSQL
jgi:hypothetical protein